MGRKPGFFHGDVFDVVMQHSKWVAKLGAIGYDFLILVNSLVNWGLEKIGREKISLSKRIKNGVKSAVKFISSFEETAARIAIEKGFNYVVCGHIHQPIIRDFKSISGNVTYLNSGDWVENLTALEYDQGQWKIFDFKNRAKTEESEEEVEEESSKKLFVRLLSEFDVISEINSFK
ncbi:MAG: hypothetical protein ABJP45_09945 [Cyclobacteriaceae bacterium]